MARIYLASSWRNAYQPDAVKRLRKAGHEVYDFRNPPHRTGFSWKEIDSNWMNWTGEQFILNLDHSAARAGFISDAAGMEWADTGVLLLPCGRSAHLEAGVFVGEGKPLHIVLDPVGPNEPELMYKMATKIHLNLESLIEELK